MEMETQLSCEVNNEDIYSGCIYEAQFFGFTPRSLLDGVYEALRSIGTEKLRDIEGQLIEKSIVPKNVLPEQVTKAVNTIVDQYDKRIKDIFEKYEDYVLKNILYIPPHVLLPEDQVQEKQYSKQEEEEVDMEIEDMKKKILAEEAMKADLEMENKELDLCLEELLQHQKQLEALSVLLNENFQDQLTDSISQLSELFSLISKTLNSRMLPIKHTRNRSLQEKPDKSVS